MEVSVNVGGETARLVVPNDVIVKIHGAAVTLTTEEDRGELRLTVRSIWGSGSLRIQQMIDDWYYGSIACTAHVTPDQRAMQQAQTAGQMQAAQNMNAHCHSCGDPVKRNNATTINGHLRCQPCASLAQAPSQQPAGAMPPWGNWPNIVGTTPAIQSVMPTLKCPHCANVFPSMAKDKAICPGCAKPMEYDINRQAWQTGGDGVATVFSDAQCPDFGAQVSDQLASARGIDRAKESDRMRVPSWEEKEAERERMANIFRARGIL